MKHNGDTFNLAIDHNDCRLLFSDDNRIIIALDKNGMVIAEITCFAEQHSDSFLNIKDLTTNDTNKLH